jgi:hypothetical protein
LFGASAYAHSFDDFRATLIATDHQVGRAETLR